ncbi:MAG: hypothetical protein PHV59_11285 [Victivallales bacterium]|nr:hypothetical protein [Victivallales bacterium]
MIKCVNQYVTREIVRLVSHRLLELRVLAAICLAMFSHRLAIIYAGVCYFDTRTLLHTLRRDDFSTSYLRALVI